MMNKKIILSILLASSVSLAKVRVAVIDSGIKKEYLGMAKLCGPVKDYVKDNVDDGYGHGTNVVGLIVKEAPKTLDYCITMYKAFSPGKTSYAAYIEALRQVVKDSPDIVNISAGGLSMMLEEKLLIQKMLDKGIIIVVAAGNNADDLDKECNYYPACSDKRLIVVGNGKNGHYAKSSNRGGAIDVVVDGQDQVGFNVKMSGTSQATARVTGFVLKFKKWTSK